MRKTTLSILIVTLFLTACANTRTVFRTETTNGQSYYSTSKPTPDNNGNYLFQDLDGNRVSIKKTQFKLTTPFTYAIRL